MRVAGKTPATRGHADDVLPPGSAADEGSERPEASTKKS